VIGEARTYAAQAWKVFPVVPRGKTPLTEHGFLEASGAEDVLEAWWRKWPDANIGVATGSVSGIVVLDVDPRHGGDRSLAALSLPETRRSFTGGGGQHLFFAHPGYLVPNATGLREGIDIRGDGGYVVVPPSEHASGGRYAWDADTLDLPLAQFPQGLVERQRKAAGRIGDSIPIGQRDSTLTSLAGSMRRRGMSAHEIEAALSAVNVRCEPPLPSSAIHRIAQSVGRYIPTARQGRRTVAEP